jgi:hypothetical protein
MIPAATAQSKTAAMPLPRMGFVYVPHGSVMDRWSPGTTGTNFELSPILKPLQAYKSQLTIVSGLRNKAAESPAPHALTAGTWLSCVHPDPQQEPLAASIDQLAVRHLGQDTPFPSLELATEACKPNSGYRYGNISFGNFTQPLPTEYNPRKVFDQLFRRGETKSILDSVLNDATALQKELGKRDSAIVSDYLDSLREIERRIQQVEKSNLATMALLDAPIGVPNDFNEHLDLMFDLIALSYQANLTRIFTFMMGHEVGMRTFDIVGVPDAFHALSHHGNNPANLDRLAKVHEYHATVFARFIKKLHDMPDGDGSMLDHSIILYGGNMGDSNLHNHSPLPSAVLGRGYGTITGGQHIQMPPNTPLANLMVTLLKSAKIPIEQIGDSTGRIAEV